MGSLLFLLGIAIFLICAAQVYGHEFLQRGAAVKGLYRGIRHPQSVALGIAGCGLAILGPRFTEVTSWGRVPIPAF